MRGTNIYPRNKTDSYPQRKKENDYSASLLNAVECNLRDRKFMFDYGNGNNVLEYMRTVWLHVWCRYARWKADFRKT